MCQVASSRFSKPASARQQTAQRPGTPARIGVGSALASGPMRSRLWTVPPLSSAGRRKASGTTPSTRLPTGWGAWWRGAGSVALLWRPALYDAMHANGYADEEGEEAVAATLTSGLDAGLLDPHPDLEEREEPRPASRSEPAAPPKSLADVHAIFRKWLGDDYGRHGGAHARRDEAVEEVKALRRQLAAAEPAGRAAGG